MVHDAYVEEELKIMREGLEKTHAIDIDFFMEHVEDGEPRPALTIEVDASIGEAVKKMKRKGKGSILIVKEKKLVGIVTERDLLFKVIGNDKITLDDSVKRIMTKNPIAIRSDEVIAYVIHNMHVGGYRHIPIVNEKHEPTHSMSMRRIIALIAEKFPREVINIVAEPYKGKPTRDSG